MRLRGYGSCSGNGGRALLDAFEVGNRTQHFAPITEKAMSDCWRGGCRQCVRAKVAA